MPHEPRQMKIMSSCKVGFANLLFLLLFFQTVKSQDALSANELENLLQKAERQSQNYGKVFQNLSAEETKTKFRFKRDGTIDEKRVIKSIFVVYQSPKDNSPQEFRNVVEFNGKNVSRDDRETAEFFEKLAKADTNEAEYAKIRKESLRYDGNRVSWGMTLYQPRPFAENLRNDFQFKVAGKEKIEGRDVWMIEYEQTKPSPYILSNPSKTDPQAKGATQYNMPLPDVLRPTNPLMRGKIWLDAETGQMWRNQFKIILNPTKISRPIEATELFYEYQSSNFGILAPKKFIVKSFQIGGDSDSNLTVAKDAETVYEYDKFSEFKTETKEYKIKN